MFNFIGPVYGSVVGVASSNGLLDNLADANFVGDVSGLDSGDATALARGVVGLNGPVSDTLQRAIRGASVLGALGR